MKSSVQILLSTYNGKKYLRCQLDSLINQSLLGNISILIRDDGSTDNTLDILKQYEMKYSFIKVTKGKNIGAKKSFFKLIQEAGEFDYYAFCDQDDYWFSDKLEKAISVLSNYNDREPLLYFSALKCVDSNLKIIEKNKTKKETAYNFGQIMIKNNANGCTMVFNNKTMDALKFGFKKTINIELLPFHDHWTYLVVLSLGGKVIYDNEARILYRQHNCNEVGMDLGIVHKLKTHKIFDGGNIRFLYLTELDRIYHKQIPIVESILLNKAIHYKKNLVQRLGLAINKQISPINFFEKIRIFFIILNNTF